MEMTFSLSPNLMLKITKGTHTGSEYPSAHLQKGLVFVYDDQELGEEAVGFGVPVLKRGLQTIFPGNIELTMETQGSAQVITAIFSLNLEEKIAHPESGEVKNKFLYTIKSILAAVIRHFPLLRGTLTDISNRLREQLNWYTIYQEVDYSTDVKIIYTFFAAKGQLQIDVDVSDLSQDGITEVIIMNEQGARYFKRFTDSDGKSLSGNEIGCWDEVRAEHASFISDSHHLVFTLHQVNRARLFRGRELIGNRLAWAGFGYSFSPKLRYFSYELTITPKP